MFKPTIESATGLYSIEKARSLAEGLQAADCEGWSYRVVDAHNGLGRNRRPGGGNQLLKL